MNVKETKKQLELLHNGSIKLGKIKRTKGQGPTPMGLPVLNDLARGGEIAMPERAERKILEALKRRLNNEQVKLLCLHCLNWSTLTRVRRLEENPKCKNCGARLLGLVPRRGNHKKILKKDRNDEEIEKDERKMVERTQKSANLILTHGKKAIIAMAARGVEPSTASRILGKQYKNEKEFFEAILRAERIYARTHRFWD